MVTINPNAGSTNKVQEEKVQEEKASVTTKVETDDLSKEYLDKRTITISVVHNYSNYRKANMKVMGHKQEVIGSSIKSCRVLSSIEGEVNKYFPAIIGLSPNNPEFITRVKAWLSNIKYVVSETDLVLDISFLYNKR